jgi:hypothetical protein
VSGRPSAAREVTSLVQSLMDGLLLEETRAGEAIDAGLRGFAVSLSERVIAAGSTRRKLRAAVPKLLPTAEQVLDIAGPAVAHLLAVSRERTLPVIARQLRAYQQVVGPHAVGASNRGVLAAESVAMDLEGHYYAAACAAIGAATVGVAAQMTRQVEIWAVSPAESAAELARRFCSEDLVRLPGSPGRGTLWQLRSICTAEARAASVSVVNGLLLAGYQGWNVAAAAS